MSNVIRQGKIVSIVAKHGFFFLRVEGERADYFAHKDDLPDGVRIEHLTIGEIWEFVAVTTHKGPRAVSMRRPGRRSLDTLVREHFDA